MEELKKIISTVDSHARETGFYMHGGDVVNFIDHINPDIGDCKACRQAVRGYTGGVVEIIVHPIVEVPAND